MLKAWFFSKFKLTAVALLLAVATATGAAVWGFYTPHETTQPAPHDKPNVSAHAVAPRTDFMKVAIGSPAISTATVEATRMPHKPSPKRNSVNIEFQMNWPGDANGIDGPGAIARPLGLAGDQPD